MPTTQPVWQNVTYTIRREPERDSFRTSSAIAGMNQRINELDMELISTRARLANPQLQEVLRCAERWADADLSDSERFEAFKSLIASCEEVKRTADLGRVTIV